MTSPRDDAELVSRTLAGDGEAFAGLVMAHQEAAKAQQPPPDMDDDSDEASDGNADDDEDVIDVDAEDA